MTSRPDEALAAEPASAPAEPLSDRWFRWRNRVLSSPRFQRWAAKFPLTRLIARTRASALFDICAGFVYSQVLFAAVRVHLFDVLGAGPQTLSDLSARLSLPPQAARRLLDAAVSLRLAERRGPQRYGLGVHGASLLGNPAIERLVEHHSLLYRDLVDPLALLRGDQMETELHRFWSYASPRAQASDSSTASYSALMTNSLDLIASDILEAYPVEHHKCLMDVAGGEGAFLAAAAARLPDLSLILFDLPPVAMRAHARLTAAGFSARANVVSGDVFVDPLPEGADLISLVRVIHDHDDAAALKILQAARHALSPGGVLLVAEPMSGTLGAEPMGDAYFGFYLLAMGQGRPRTIEELSALLRESGFTRVKSRKTRRPMLTRLLVAETR